MKSLRAWFRPPRHLLALFLFITLAPSMLLVAFGWRSLEHDRALDLQQIQDRREQAADLAVSGLQQSLDAVERQLRLNPSALNVSEDAAAVVFTPGSVQGKLLYYPVSAVASEAPAKQFAAAEKAELAQDEVSAAAAFRELASPSSDVAVQAGALIGLARVLRNSGQPDAALGVYAAAAKLDGPTVSGLPVGLFAAWAKCDLLEMLNRKDDLRREAKTLYSGLLQGRWQLDRTAWETNIGDARRWMGDNTTGDLPPAGVLPKDALQFAEAAEWLWNKWTTRPSGRELVHVDGRDIAVLWSGDSGHVDAFLAGPDYAEREWVRKLAPVLERQHARVSLHDPAEHFPLGPPGTRRAAPETRLPWTLVVESVNVTADLDQLAGRRRLWLAGLGMLVPLVVSGTWLIARAVMRDLAVARLQSDFVSAVSHEFRTPLTSLRQITEILADGRIVNEDRRRTYYQALERQTGRLHQLVESLLDFGRMEAGTSPYRLEPLDACALIRTVVEQFEREASGRGYHVELDVNGVAAPIVATIAGDREALTNALWNLLDNAVKYSLECRTVWVEVQREDGRLAVRVRDRGLGIPHEEQREIFRKFVRGARAKVEGIKGTGIGLAMVDHIIKAHGGEVRLQSEPGAGSTFTLVLPCHES
jgi:signal transduction histidine kinase